MSEKKEKGNVKCLWVWGNGLKEQLTKKKDKEVLVKIAASVLEAWRFFPNRYKYQKAC